MVADRTDNARCSVPAYPFEPPPAAGIRDRLHELERAAAATALAAMAGEWGRDQPSGNRPERDALLADAGLLLDRYGPDARFWTNAVEAASDPARDFVRAGLNGTRATASLRASTSTASTCSRNWASSPCPATRSESSGPSARTDADSPDTQTLHRPRTSLIAAR